MYSAAEEILLGRVKDMKSYGLDEMGLASFLRMLYFSSSSF